MENPSVIRVLKNGPYLVSGKTPLFDATIKCDSQGIPAQWLLGEPMATGDRYILCRCGQSNIKPFCDGTHAKVGFDGTEVSDNTPYTQMAKVIEGPKLRLLDAEIPAPPHASATAAETFGPKSQNPTTPNSNSTRPATRATAPQAASQSSTKKPTPPWSRRLPTLSG